MCARAACIVTSPKNRLVVGVPNVKKEGDGNKYNTNKLLCVYDAVNLKLDSIKHKQYKVD